MPRLSLPNEELTKPVPSLLDRQYVVEKSKKSPEQARMDKELFWYRDTLLSSLQATWVEVSSVSKPSPQLTISPDRGDPAR